MSLMFDPDCYLYLLFAVSSKKVCQGYALVSSELIADKTDLWFNLIGLILNVHEH